MPTAKYIHLQLRFETYMIIAFNNQVYSNKGVFKCIKKLCNRLPSNTHNRNK